MSDVYLTLNLKQLICMPKHCIYALVNEEDKRFAIGFTKHLLVGLSRINQDLETPKYKDVKYDMSKIEVKILETDVVDDTRKKFRASIYVDKYLEEGYKQYYPTNLIRYKVCTNAIFIDRKMLYCVYLKNRNSDVIIGLFDDEKEMTQYLNVYYPNKVVSGEIRYASNKYSHLLHRV